MKILGKKKVVLLGMMTRIPVAGAVWGTMQYLVGLRRLGYDAYYVEAHARTPAALMRTADDDSSALAAAYLADVMRRFDMEDRWAFHALHLDDGGCYGMTEGQLKDLYREAALIINYHGATVPLPEHSATGRLIYLETDPVELEIGLSENDPEAIEFLEPHVAFFTWGLNYGRPDCRVPVPARFPFRTTCPPVVLDLWQPEQPSNGRPFTTVGNWQQLGREVIFQGEVYQWSKHFEFLKFIDLPQRTTQAFELALSSISKADKSMLQSKGWKVRDAFRFSGNLDAYRKYITASRGEYTVAKDQNVRLRSGWFSERSAQYLAAGRPVITEETGFSNALPTGAGLFGFSTMEEILGAVDTINGNYERASRAASDVAREHFSYDVVLPRLLAEMGV